VLVDSVRGRHTAWTRIRINLQNVPVELRPPQEPLDPDEKVETDWIGPQKRPPKTQPVSPRSGRKKSPPADTT
jgi:hypothetical protein